MNSLQEIDRPSLLFDVEDIPRISDTNANVSEDLNDDSNPNKTPNRKSFEAAKKSVKFNNNLDNMSTLNSDESVKLNGVSNGPNNYLEELIQPSCSFNTYKYDDKGESSDSATLPLSDDDADILSVSDDGCFYTYKRDNVADLPSSFFALDIPPDRQEVSPNRNDVSSPEMDYLEMDFDPGYNGELDSVSDNDNGSLFVQRQEQLPQIMNEIEPQPSTSSHEEEMREIVQEEIEERVNVHELPPAVEPSTSKASNGIIVKHSPEVEKMPWSCNILQRTKSLNFRVMKKCHLSRGDLLSPSENVPQIKGALVTKQCAEQNNTEREEIESAMIWTREEANLKQITQIGPSACGATAVLNVLKALRFPLPPFEKVAEYVNTRGRRYYPPLADYLIARSNAGSNHEDIIDGLHKISNGLIYARFFHMYPERLVNLDKWLSFWIKNGAVPIATMNLQRCYGTIPDAWHHQMIFGVDSNGIHLTNPLECVEAGLLWPQLCSESVLLVRREDVLARWNFRIDLPDLMRIKDIRWRRMNVVGQVANMIHEHGRELRVGFTNTSHIRIPAAYSSGITLATIANSPACVLLKQSPELPLLETYE